MNGANWVLSAETALYFANVAVSAAVACAAGLLVARVCRRRPVPLRYGVLLAAMVLTLLSTALPYVAQRTRSGLLEVPATVRTLGGAPRVRPAPYTPSLSASLEPVGRRPEPRAPAAALPAVEWRPPVPWGRLGASLLVVVWAAGAAVYLARLAWGTIRVAQFRRTFIEPEDPTLLAAAGRAAAALGLARAPRLRLSPATPVPLVVGLWRSAIVLPENLSRELDADQLAALLLHETGHLVHHDHWVGLVQRLVATIFWPLPLVHMVNRQLSALREEICDNYVVQVYGTGRRLAEVLVLLAERLADAAPLPATIGLLEPAEDGLPGRMERLLQKDRNTMTRMNRLTLLATAAFGLLVAVAMLVAHVRTQPQRISAPRAAAADSRAAQLKVLEGEIRSKQQELRNLATQFDSGGDPETVSPRMQFEFPEFPQFRILANQAANMQEKYSQARGELEVNKELLKRANGMVVPAADLDLLIHNDPVADSLSKQVAGLTMELDAMTRSTKPGERNARIEMLALQLHSAQQEYDQKLDELKAKARGKKRSDIEQSVVRYEVLLAQAQKSKEELAEEIRQKLDEIGKRGRSAVYIEMPSRLQVALPKGSIQRSGPAVDPEKMFQRTQAAFVRLGILEQQAATLQGRYREIRSELEVSKELLKFVDKMKVPTADLDVLIHNDPVANPLSRQVAGLKMELEQLNRSTRPGERNARIEMLTVQLESAQKQYAQELDELEEKAREKKRSEIEQKIVRYEVLLAQTQRSKEQLAEQIKQKREEAGKLDRATADAELLLAQINDLEERQHKIKGLEDRSAGLPPRHAGMPAEPAATVPRPAEIASPGKPASRPKLANDAKPVTEMYLVGNEVTDAAVERLAELPQLQSLFLIAPQVTDAGLRNLGRLGQLRTLYLICPRVTDAGLEHLKGLTRLQTLHLDVTAVTDAAVKDLQAALPNCKIQCSRPATQSRETPGR